MKTTRLILVFCLAIMAFSNVNAQKNKIDSISVNFDCAKHDHSISVADISVADLKNCKKLIITGTSHEEFKILTAVISLKVGSNLKEFVVKEGIFIEELSSAISQQTPGSKMYIEEVKIQNIKDPTIIKKLKTVSLIAK